MRKYRLERPVPAKWSNRGPEPITGKIHGMGSVRTSRLRYCTSDLLASGSTPLPTR